MEATIIISPLTVKSDYYILHSRYSRYKIRTTCSEIGFSALEASYFDNEKSKRHGTVCRGVTTGIARGVSLQSVTARR